MIRAWSSISAFRSSRGEPGRSISRAGHGHQHRTASRGRRSIVRPGDIVFAEIDGVVFIPQDAAEETVSRAFEKVAKGMVRGRSPRRDACCQKSGPSTASSDRSP